MGNKAIDDASTTDICRRMNNVRCRLGDDVEEMVESARVLADWRYYVKTYPWVCLAGAVGVGYLVVPNRVEIMSPTADELEKLAKRDKLVVKSNPEPKARGGIGGVLFGALANVAIRGAMRYAEQTAGRVLDELNETRDNDAKQNK